MARWRSDSSFFPSPGEAVHAPTETLAYVALLNPAGTGQSDGIGVVDLDPASPDYGTLVHTVEFPDADNELHLFGWNACSSCLCPYAARAPVERRYLVVPGTHSSRIHVVDTGEDPRRPRLHKVIEGDEVRAKTGYAAPHAVHSGPDGIFLNALGAPGGDGPGGLFVLDPATFEIRGRWESDRGSQYLSYDFGWHPGHDTLITSEWGTPNMVHRGMDPELLFAGKYGNALHVWDVRTKTHRQTLALGRQYQMTRALRPAHNPVRAWGFAGVVLSLEDFSSSVWMWYLDRGNGHPGGTWKTRKVIDIPARVAPAGDLPPLLKGFGAVPPLVTDINLSVDDKTLYVSCWGTGELKQYDVSDPFHPRETATLALGGIVRRTPHPGQPGKALNGGPQMVEVSRDGRRVYVTNALYSPWDAQFYPEGLRGWMARVDAAPGGGMRLDERCFVEFDGLRPHQVRLEGGDASSDSFCFS